MLKRTYKDARMKLDRDHALNTAMSVVLNLKEKEDQHSGWYSNPAQQSFNPYTGGAISVASKRDLQRQLGMPL